MLPRCRTQAHSRSSSIRPARRWGSGSRRRSDREVAGFSVTVATDDSSGLNAYLAVPNADDGPGLVLFPDGSGADQERQAIAHLYAAEGYVVLCPSAEFDATNIADITAIIAALASVMNARAKSVR